MADDEHDCPGKWITVTGQTAWCDACGTLRVGTYLGLVYQDDEGNDIKLTSTGFYHPYGGWQEGPVPSEFQRSVYGPPYTYRTPQKPALPLCTCGHEANEHLNAGVGCFRCSCKDYTASK